MKSCSLPQDQCFWYLNKQNNPPLRENITTDVVVVGGGMAGLTAAQSFCDRGLKVVLIEKDFCGAGASGKSSGFITPNSELSLDDLTNLFNQKTARKLWDFVSEGVHSIRQNIKEYNLECDYQEQETLVVAHSQKSFKGPIQSEFKARLAQNFTSTIYQQEELNNVLHAQHYHGGIVYGDSFGINGYNYCQGMKQILMRQGVRIYEDTPALEIHEHQVVTPHAIIKAEYSIVCLDYFVNNFKKFLHQVYHVQTFLMLSEPLSNEQVAQIFPKKRYLVWDTELIYNYFRLTGDNRLLLGGSGLIYTYAQGENHNNHRMSRYLLHYFEKHFPHIKVQFRYIWPGLIGVSKDMLPIAGRDTQLKNVYYISAATGLPWAAALGRYSAQHMIDGKNDFDEFFSPERPFTLGPITQTLLGTPLTFALSHAIRLSSL